MTSPPTYLTQLDFFAATTDLQGNLTWFNQTETFVGVQPLEGFQGKHFADQLWWSHSSYVRRRVKHMVEHVCTTGEPAPPIDITAFIHDGSLLKVAFHINPLFNESGELIGTMPHAVKVRRHETEDSFDALAGQLLYSLREDEKALQLLEGVMEILPIPLVLVNSEGVAITNNKAARDSTRGSANLEGIEKWSGDYYRPDGTIYTNQETPLGRALSLGEEVKDELMIVRFKNLDHVEGIRASARPIYYHGEMLGAVCYWTSEPELTHADLK